MGTRSRIVLLNNGVSMPTFGLGTWKSSPGEVGRAVRVAIRIGYRHIDCAAIYGNEAEVGQAIAAAIAAKEVRREDLWITTKLWNSEHAPGDVRPALEASLEKLRLDYLDLYLIHWPIAMVRGSQFPWQKSDFLSLSEVPLERTWEAVCTAGDAGLARAVGVSNMGPKRLAMLSAAALTPAVNQVECHPLLQQRGLASYCKDHGIFLTAYSPLGSRDRAAPLKGDSEPSLLDHPDVAEIAAAYEIAGVQATAAQVLLAWSLGVGNGVIPKSTNAGRLQQNFEAQGLELSGDHMAKLAALDRGFRYITGSVYTIEGSPYTHESLWEI